MEYTNVRRDNAQSVTLEHGKPMVLVCSFFSAENEVFFTLLQASMIGSVFLQDNLETAYKCQFVLR
jgi:hypothetical protein